MSGIDWDLLSSYAGLLALASGSIYAGAFGSLPNQDGLDDEEEDIAERVSSDDALFFPFVNKFIVNSWVTLKMTFFRLLPER